MGKHGPEFHFMIPDARRRAKPSLELVIMMPDFAECLDTSIVFVANNSKHHGVFIYSTELFEIY